MLGRRTRAAAYAGDAPVVEEDDGSMRRSSEQRPTEGTAARAGRRTVGGVSLVLARVIMFVAGIVALIIALGIAVVVLHANPSNTIVSHVHSWARTLAGPFDGMFTLRSAKATIALNWGIALIVYLVVASLIASPLMGAAWWGRATRRATI
jgi:hypothetical protein